MTQRMSVLGVMISAIDRTVAAQMIIDAARSRQPLGVSALAVHGVMTGVLDNSQRQRINSLELVVPDGQPVRWALNWLHEVGLTDRVAGPDLMAEVCEVAAREGMGIYLLGSTQTTLQRLSRALKDCYPEIKIVGTRPSRFRQATEDERFKDLAAIRASGAQLVFVGLGAPRQEAWAYENRLELSIPVIAVGAAFDYFAGNLDRAPLWMQRAGLEWLHRLAQEPIRLWRRYLLLNPVYLLLVALQKAGFQPNGEPEAFNPPTVRPG